jgi:membrane-associated phospholipid phosphatase
MGLRADDVVTLAYLICLTALVLLFHRRVEHAWIYPLVHLLWGAEILFLIRKAAARPVRPWIQARNWYHVLSIPMAFRELHYLVHPINPVDMDPILIQWDHALLGVHPTVWLERWTTPWLTEFLQVVYTSFYFLPIILGILLWRARDMEGFQATLVGVVTTFYVSYLAYFAFPALGPRFELAALQGGELEGIWLTHWLRGGLDSLELIQRDAFPSGHVGVSLMVLYCARRYRPGAFLPYLVVVSCLVVSTVYLRYHYVVDVLSGVILALASGWIARALRRVVESGAVDARAQALGCVIPGRQLIRPPGEEGERLANRGGYGRASQRERS